MKLEDKCELKRRDLGLTLWKKHYSTLINHKYHRNREYISSSLTQKVDITIESIYVYIVNFCLSFTRYNQTKIQWNED